ncbi:MAG: hypothetical protein ACE149_05535 [Armatimonadota bacterium]
MYFAFEGDRYRYSLRTLVPAGEAAPTMAGYDGRTAWSGSEGFSETVRSSVSRAKAITYLGLYGVYIAPNEPEAALASRIRRLNPTLVGTQKLGGHMCYVLKYGPPPDKERRPAYMEFTAWVAPELGYAVIRRDQLLWNGVSAEGKPVSPLRWRSEWSDFGQYGRNLWLPRRHRYVEERQQADGAWLASFTTTARAEYLRVNLGLPDSEFRPPWELGPPGRH